MLTLNQVSKTYGDQTVLKDISLSLSKGEILAILGPSGCGKTTLLNVILGLEETSGGQIFYDQADYTKRPMHKRGFNIVFQDYALFEHLSVEQNIRYGLRNKPNASTASEVNDLIDLLDLSKHLSKTPHQLSGGQKQRVALARTLVMKPKILLLDEPLAALDGVIKENIKQRISQIAKTLQLMTIIVTHDPEEALTLSDKVLILNEGQVVQFASPLEIIQHPADAFVERFIIRQLQVKNDNIAGLFGVVV